MSESKEVARRVAQWLRDQKMSFREINSLSNELSKAFDALNIAFAPPVVEGSVKVRIAVACSHDGDEVSVSSPIGFTNEMACIECLKARHHVSTSAYAEHAAIVEVMVPPIAPTPTVAGRVV